jgi:hypothetical protein
MPAPGAFVTADLSCGSQTRGVVWSTHPALPAALADPHSSSTRNAPFSDSTCRRPRPGKHPRHCRRRSSPACHLHRSPSRSPPHTGGGCGHRPVSRHCARQVLLPRICVVNRSTRSARCPGTHAELKPLIAGLARRHYRPQHRASGCWCLRQREPGDELVAATARRDGLDVGRATVACLVLARSRLGLRPVVGVSLQRPTSRPRSGSGSSAGSTAAGAHPARNARTTRRRRPPRLMQDGRAGGSTEAVVQIG